MNVEIGSSKNLHARLSAIKALVFDSARQLPPPAPAVALFFTVSDGEKRARVVNASGESLEAVWDEVVALLLKAMSAENIDGRWLRVDWIEAFEETTWQRLDALLRKTKRNYFRFGVALDPDFRFAFTEQELNANAMLYGGNTISHAVLNATNFNLYASTRYEGLPPIGFSEHDKIFLFSTKGFFCDEMGTLHSLDGTGLETGRRSIKNLDGEEVLSLVRTASAYLARQVHADGTFVYGYHPCFDRRIAAYNTLRHASTTYAMIEAWGVTGETRLRAAIERALEHLVGALIRPVELDDGTRAAFLVDVGDEIKLGGNAVAILALVKYMTATGSSKWRDVAEMLAVGIRHMQDRQTGAFVHVLKFPDLSILQAYRTIYYEGEAAFALMRLYDLTGDPQWRDVVEKAFEHFIASKHEKHHDHWLSYCVNELTRHRPDERYFRFGISNIAGYLDFVENRITTFPTLLELMMAAREMLSRIAEDTRFHRLLDEIDLSHFERALEKRARHLLNGHFWPEIAMYFRKPNRIVGSFFIRHHAFRVRIDDVEHYLSGLIAYRKYIEERAAFRALVDKQSEQLASGAAVAEQRVWTADRIEDATGGRWIRRPSEGWKASGLCTFAPVMRPGDMVVVRGPGETVGVRAQRLPKCPNTAGMMTSDPNLISHRNSPLLQVRHCGDAVLAMGSYARDRMSGHVLAVTGSAGKSTVVAMLAQALPPFGSVGTSAHNANLPIGVACNLASIPWNTEHVVLELAVGKMGVSARIARPKIAIFTNISPAHLGEKDTTADIAKTKSAIFSGMRPGDTAILNRDMLEWNIVHNAASRHGLNVVTYGFSDGCAFQLLHYNAVEHWAIARNAGREFRYRVGAAGRHMALNGLAVLAAISALGYDLEGAISQLEKFVALPGRGEKINLSLDGGRLTLIDDAYNANPGSMRAALELLNKEAGRRRIAVLGEMAELGPHAAGYHSELAAVLEGGAIDKVYLIGGLFASLWEALSPSLRGGYASSATEMKKVLRSHLQEEDVVLFKGSNSVGMHGLVEWLKENAGNPPGSDTVR